MLDEATSGDPASSTASTSSPSPPMADGTERRSRHTALSLVHASRCDFDLVHVHAIGPGVLLPVARVLGLRPAVFTFHSFDYLRSKWGPGARAFLRFCEWVSVRSADAIIAVSEAGTEHIVRRYHRQVRHVPNGPGRLQRRAPGEEIDASRPHVGTLHPDRGSTEPREAP